MISYISSWKTSKDMYSLCYSFKIMHLMCVSKCREKEGLELYAPNCLDINSMEIEELGDKRKHIYSMYFCIWIFDNAFMSYLYKFTCIIVKWIK